MQPDTRDALLASARDTYEKCLAVLQDKNADYATITDPFANFRSASVVGVDPARAILVRIMDKIARISNLLARPAQNESLEDSCEDAINYFAILKAFVAVGKIK